MKQTMKVAYLTNIDKIVLGDEPIPAIRPGCVKIKLEACGVCGSDVHLYHNGCAGKFKVEFPYVLGHECMGTVVEVADDVVNRTVGDRVAVEPGVPCGICEYCRTGKYNLCPDVIFLAAPPYAGCLKEYIVYPANFTYKLPENMSSDEGALLEPLAVGLNAADTAEVKLGNTVLVMGAGCIGLMCALSARAMGATSVYVCDVLQNRLKQAEDLGFHAIDAEKMSSASLPEFNAVIDAAGGTNTIQNAIQYVKLGGRIVCVGLANDKVDDFDLAGILQKEITLKGIFRYKNNYETAINAVSTGKISLNGIVSHVYDFLQTPVAFQEAIEKRKEIVKSMIRFT